MVSYLVAEWNEEDNFCLEREREEGFLRGLKTAYLHFDPYISFFPDFAPILLTLVFEIRN